MNIFIATDHAGFEMKEYIKKVLEKFEYSVQDCGATTFNSNDDYPEYIHSLSKEIVLSGGIDDVGIIFGGSGQGEAMVANRYPYIRAIVYAGVNLELVKLGREHNNANILSIGARFISNEDAKEAVELFLRTPFSYDERHIRRISQMDKK